MVLKVKKGESSGKDGGVRRVNNMPLMLICGVLAAFVGLIVMVGLNRMDKSRDGRLDDAVGSESNMAGHAMSAVDNMNGIIPESGGMSLGVVRDPDAPPVPPEGAPGASGDPFRDARLAMLQKAILAKTGLTASSAGGAKGAAAQPGRTGAQQPPAAQPPGRQEPGRTPRPAMPGGDGTNGTGVFHAGGSYAEFDGGQEDRWFLGNRPQKPRTPFELRAGFIIPAVLMSAVNSELPGQIIGQVSEDVYDTPTGKYKLIPQGTRLIGAYSSDIAYGQSRMLVAWQRLVFPDGKAMDIGAMPGTSGDGTSGFNDRVNNHYVRIFGSALLMSGVIAAVNKTNSNPNSDPYGSSNSTLLSQAIATQLGNVATQMIQKNLNIAPTLEIRPGYRFNVMVVKDLTFEKPYRAFDY